MRARGLSALLLLMLPAASLAATAQTVRVRTVEGGNLRARFPEGFEKPAARWSGKVLYVRFITTRANFEALKDDQADLSLDRNALHLTYQMKPVGSPLLKPGQPPPPGEAVPMLLEFKVDGLPKRDYRIFVSRAESKVAPRPR